MNPTGSTGAVQPSLEGTIDLEPLLGVRPVALLVRLVWIEAMHGARGLPLLRFVQWCANSFQLAALASLLSAEGALARAGSTSTPASAGMTTH